MIKRSRLLFMLMVCCIAAEVVFAQIGNPGDAIETAGSGQINWTSGEVFATGIGAPPSQPVNAAQARAMTERAAFVVALRNLLETVKGVRVDSESVVENFMVKSDVIKTRVDGIVRGARIVKTQYMSDGSVEVLVAMSMKGALMDAIVPETFGRPLSSTTPQRITPTPQPPGPPIAPPTVQKLPEPSKPLPPSPSATLPEKKMEPPKQPEPFIPAPSSPDESTTIFKGGTATGLVIDGRGLGLRPALLPKIIDTQGQELYVGQVVTRTNAVDQGVAGYAKDVNAAANNFRVTDNPAVIKGLRASGAAKTDIVVSQADAQSLRQLGNKGDFLQYCRVIIVY
ncbi:MAG TPA: LPP20 family lipoprotein [Nitrospirota bacterium]|nr:LPP20 family lipoprotein [Nitrospirota bacterium]